MRYSTAIISDSLGSLICRALLALCRAHPGIVQQDFRIYLAGIATVVPLSIRYAFPGG